MTTNTEAMRAALEAFLTELEDSENDFDAADCVRKHQSRLAAALSQAEQRQESKDAQRIAELTLQVQQLQERFDSANRMRNAALAELAALRSAAPQPEEPDLPACLQRQAS